MSIGTNYRYLEFELDSYDANATLGNGDATYYNWPLFDLGRPLDGIAYLKVLEVQIPFTWYVFNNENNGFFLNEPGGAFPVQFPIGNYTATQIASTLGPLLTTVSAQTGAGGFTYTCTYSSVTQKFTITATGVPSGDTFGLSFTGSEVTESNNDPSMMLGANPSQTSTPNTTGTCVLVMPNIALVTGPNYLYLNSQRMGSLCNLYLPYGSQSRGNLASQIAKIPVTVQPGGVIFWADPAPQHWFKIDALSNLPTIDFYLSLGNWQSNTPLNLNGIGFSIKLGMLVEEPTENVNMSGMAIDNHVIAMNTPISTKRPRRS